MHKWRIELGHALLPCVSYVHRSRPHNQSCRREQKSPQSHVVLPVEKPGHRRLHRGLFRAQSKATAPCPWPSRPWVSCQMRRRRPRWWRRKWSRCSSRHSANAKATKVASQASNLDVSELARTIEFILRRFCTPPQSLASSLQYKDHENAKTAT